MRGTVIEIGRGFKFTMPMESPSDDAAVIKTEELIARIDQAAAPFRQIAERAALAKKTLREDITSAFRMRLEEANSGPSLMDKAEVEDTPGRKPRIRKDVEG